MGSGIAPALSGGDSGVGLVVAALRFALGTSESSGIDASGAGLGCAEEEQVDVA